MKWSTSFFFGGGGGGDAPAEYADKWLLEIKLPFHELKPTKNTQTNIARHASQETWPVNSFQKMLLREI
jgi:hypothetical protein